MDREPPCSLSPYPHWVSIYKSCVGERGRKSQSALCSFSKKCLFSYETAAREGDGSDLSFFVIPAFAAMTAVPLRKSDEYFGNGRKWLSPE